MSNRNNERAIATSNKTSDQLSAISIQLRILAET
jgi:hypothetical protein